jgi:hypothetical protein
VLITVARERNQDPSRTPRSNLVWDLFTNHINRVDKGERHGTRQLAVVLRFTHAARCANQAAPTPR